MGFQIFVLLKLFYLYRARKKLPGNRVPERKKGKPKQPGDAKAIEESTKEFKIECRESTGLNPDSPDPTGW